MCSASAAEFDSILSSEGLRNISSNCRLPFGACSRLFNAALAGVAGSFSDAQLDAFRLCLPGGAVWYQERDGSVEKAEDERMFRVDHGPSAPSAAAGRRRGAGRRLSQGVFLDPPAELNSQALFEHDSSVDGGRLDLYSLAQGTALSAPVQKQQLLLSKLWSLDRVDQRALPLDGLYRYGDKAANATGLGQVRG
jgi:hypothetical protein